MQFVDLLTFLVYLYSVVSCIKYRGCLLDFASYISVCCRLVAKWCLTLQFHGLQPARLLCPWDFPGKNAGVGVAISFSEGSS